MCGAAPYVWLPSKFECHYEGKRIDGTVFHTTDTNGKEIWGVERGVPHHHKTETFSTSGVLKGWKEVLPLMRQGEALPIAPPVSLICKVLGDIWELYVPSEFAYGERGAGSLIR